MKFAEKILRLRKSKGMSQEDLAEKLNVSRQAISRWEMGTAQPDVQNILQISRLFGVTTDYLINDDHDSDQQTPCVKELCSQLNASTQKRRKFYLIGGISWLIAAFCFLIASIDTLNIVFVILSLADTAIAVIFFLIYWKTKE